MLLLHFLERGSGQGFIIKRKLRGVVTSPMENPPPGSKAGGRSSKQSQKRARQANVQVVQPYLPRVTECWADIIWVNRSSDFHRLL